MTSVDTVELTRLPSCLNCLTWSEDGELAVAASEEILILTPKSSISTSGSVNAANRNTKWHVAHFQANLFTTAEWPTQYHDRFAAFSIGREQSTDTIIALQWSPPGLAKHQRSLLAVLTSNLILSLWETNGEIGNWKRVVVVNHALENFFGPAMDELDPVRRRTCVRSFSWGSRCLDELGATEGRSCCDLAAHSGHFLAVCNDNAEIAIVNIASNERVPGSRAGYTSITLGKQSIPSVLSLARIEPESLFYASLRSENTASHLSWGPWRQEKSTGEQRSLLAVLHQLKIDFLDIRQPPGSTTVITSWIDLSPGLPSISGQLAWNFKVSRRANLFTRRYLMIAG